MGAQEAFLLGVGLGCLIGCLAGVMIGRAWQLWDDKLRGGRMLTLIGSTLLIVALFRMRSMTGLGTLYLVTVVGDVVITWILREPLTALLMQFVGQ